MWTEEASRMLGSGESALPRKRFRHLRMEAKVFQEATNLMPPELLVPPTQPTQPAQPPSEAVISGFNSGHIGCLRGVQVRRRRLRAKLRKAKSTALT